MKKYTSALLFLIVSSMPVFAQHICNTSFETQWQLVERLKENRANVEHLEVATFRDEITYVPIKVHLVAKADGSNRVSEGLMPDLLCNLNTYFEDTDIQFYFKMPFNFIDHNGLYSNPEGAAGGPGGGPFQISANKVNNAINVFITGQVAQGTGGYYLGPPGINDYLVIPKSNVFGFALPHELGHFFSLAHPFFGWGQAGDNVTGWDPNVHGNPVGTFAPVGDPSTGQQVLNEKMDMSNCLEAADAICDTAPDYYFAESPGYTNGSCASVNLGAMDPNGDVVDPDENNIMNYYFGCDNYIFTAGQSEAMINDLYSSPRNYIRPNYTPSLEEVTEVAELVYPINSEITAGYNQVEFDWNEVPGAEYYILEIDFFPTFAGAPKRFVVHNATFKVVDEEEFAFNANSVYYWRVRPFGEYYSCGVQWSDRGDFVTGSIVNTQEVDEVNGWSIRPNPVQAGGILQIEVEAAQYFQGTVNLYSTTGQLLKSVNRLDFNTGVTNVEMNVAGLSAGIYIATIETNVGVVNKKVLITK